MRKVAVLFGVVALVAMLAPSAGAQTASIKDVAWLQGCWELRDGDRVVEERWMLPRREHRPGADAGLGRRNLRRPHAASSSHTER